MALKFEDFNREGSGCRKVEVVGRKPAPDEVGWDVLTSGDPEKAPGVTKTNLPYITHQTDNV